MLVSLITGKQHGVKRHSQPAMKRAKHCEAGIIVNSVSACVSEKSLNTGNSLVRLLKT